MNFLSKQTSNTFNIPLIQCVANTRRSSIHKQTKYIFNTYINYLHKDIRLCRSASSHIISDSISQKNVYNNNKFLYLYLIKGIKWQYYILRLLYMIMITCTYIQSKYGLNLINIGFFAVFNHLIIWRSINLLSLLHHQEGRMREYGQYYNMDNMLLL